MPPQLEQTMILLQKLLFRWKTPLTECTTANVTFNVIFNCLKLFLTIAANKKRRNVGMRHFSIKVIIIYYNYYEYNSTLYVLWPELFSFVI